METTYTQKIQIHKENRLAGLHPAIKFLIVILYTVCTFVISSIHVTRYNLSLFIIPMFLVIPILCAASGIFKKGMKAMKAVAIVALVIFLVQTFIVPGGEIVWRAGILRICQNGLKTAISLSFMVLNIAGIFVWLFQTTENKEIAAALDEAGLNHKVAYVFTATLKMINVLSNDSKKIMDAQQARGVETKGNVFVRAKAFVPTLIPLILSSVVGSEERVMTLEARGFSVTTPKTHLFNLERSGIEEPVKIISVIITILVIVGRILLWIL